MSGSSLDGIDFCISRFERKDQSWNFKMIGTYSFELNKALKTRLKNSATLSQDQLGELDQDYGSYIGNCLHSIKNLKNQVQFIGLHGHTVFHEPNLGYSTQIGNAQLIADKIGIEIYSDFRNPNIKLGGQGAPLVPIGDKLLFSDYDAWLNLGGIVNLSFKSGGLIKAADITYCNQALNHLANKLGLEYDDNGNISRTGRINEVLLERLQSDPYLTMHGAKSLNNQNFKILYAPKLDMEKNIADALQTYCHFLGIEIAANLKEHSNCLVTGGGVFNSYLIEVIQSYTSTKLVVPSKSIIAFKEALVFAFLALLRKLEVPNVLAEYTGASKDCISGTRFTPKGS